MPMLLLADLVSDTVTRPTAGMREAMAHAEVGDEQRGEDPTTRALEERMAAMLGMDAAVFMPSATMSNQVAIQLHVKPGDEVIAHATAHVINHEAGGIAANARAQVRALDTPRGVFTAEDLKDAVRAPSSHFPRSALVVLENTSNGGGGSCWKMAQVREVLQAARGLGLKAHLDGARFFNAVIALNVTAQEVAQGFDTVTVCLSKGLGCPAGALLCVRGAGLESEARRIKHRMGGAMRQSGILAAAGLYALEHHIPRLRDDHLRARALHAVLKDLPELQVEDTESNLLYFSVPPDAAAAERYLAALLARRVRMASAGGNRIRACFHLDVTDAGLLAATDACRAAVKAV